MEEQAKPLLRPGQWIQQQLRLFFIALQFFTRIPIPQWVGFSNDWLQASIRYFPAVGIVVGFFASASFVLLGWIWPQPVAVLLSTSAVLYLTGAFHEDGFADMCDGFGGGHSKERILEIMTDSRIGAYGAIGIGLLLAIKCVVLSSLPFMGAACALLIAHPLSRLASSALIWRLPYVKQEGKAKPLAHQMKNCEFGIAMIAGMAPLLVVGLTGQLSWQALAIGILAAALFALWLSRRFIKGIGGYTGDCLGAVQQVSETAFYLGILTMAGQ
jgi:adenosylcobinamide-GDP ribazoletransferase